MSHVDEGALHAYLDGALDEYPAAEADRIRDHVEVCAQCAIRLEAERRVRQDAQAILDLAAPTVEAPSFEELRAYVRATRPKTGPMSRMYRLGWAASIMVALGAGWFLRDGQLANVSSEAPQADLVAPAVPTADGVQPEAALEVSQEPAPTNSAVATVEASDARPAREESVAAEASAEREQDTFRQAAGTPGIVVEEELSDAAKTDQPAEEEFVPAAPPAAADEVGRVAEDLDQVVARRTEDVGAGADAASRSNEVAEALGAALEANAVASLPPEEQRVADSLASDPVILDPSALRAQVEAAPPTDEPERRRATGPETTSARIDVTAAGARDLRGFSDTSDDEAEELLEDEPQLIVPGVEVLAYANLAEGTTPSGLHIIQRMSTGEILDVYHLPEGVDPSVLAPVEAGRNEVLMEREGRWVVLRAALEVETLQELLARLNPEG